MDDDVVRGRYLVGGSRDRPGAPIASIKRAHRMRVSRQLRLNIVKIIACMAYDITGCSSRTRYNWRMHASQLRAAIAFGLFMGLMAGCAGHSSTNPAESLDERTGMTVGSLHKPIELVQSVEFSATPG